MEIHMIKYSERVFYDEKLHSCLLSNIATGVDLDKDLSLLLIDSIKQWYFIEMQHN